MTTTKNEVRHGYADRLWFHSPLSGVYRRYFLLFTILTCLLAARTNQVSGQQLDSETERNTVILVQGAGGTPEYKETFSEVCKKIDSAVQTAKWEFALIGGPTAGDSNEKTDQKTDKDIFQETIESKLTEKGLLWIIFVGHGTFDNQTAKFNLRGPDVSAKELSDWLKPSKRSVAIVNCASASAPFINRLSASNRVIVTATKSGFEMNYTRFGKYFADALTDLAADIDKDEQVSLLESYLYATKKVDEYYRTESRLATEHALIDDNGDGKGTPLTFFKGVRVIKTSKDDSIPDGTIANQIHLIESQFERLLTAEVKAKRNELELELEQLRLKKDELDQATYLDELESITLQLAKIYKQVEDENQPGSKGPTDKPKSGPQARSEAIKKEASESSKK